MRQFEHLTFCELEIHIEVAQAKLNQHANSDLMNAAAVAEKMELQNQITALKNELDERRDNLLK